MGGGSDGQKHLNPTLLLIASTQGKVPSGPVASASQIHCGGLSVLSDCCGLSSAPLPLPPSPCKGSKATPEKQCPCPARTPFRPSPPSSAVSDSSCAEPAQAPLPGDPRPPQSAPVKCPWWHIKVWGVGLPLPLCPEGAWLCPSLTLTARDPPHSALRRGEVAKVPWWARWRLRTGAGLGC